jgi:hypothetical protein
MNNAITAAHEAADLGLCEALDALTDALAEVEGHVDAEWWERNGFDEMILCARLIVLRYTRAMVATHEAAAEGRHTPWRRGER